MSTVACYGFSRMLSSTGTMFSSISSLYPGQQERCSFRTSRPWLRMQRFSYVQRDQSLRAGPSIQARSKNEKPAGKSKLRRLRARARLLNFMLKKQLPQVTFANLVKSFQRNWRPVMVGGFLAFLFVIGSVFARLSAAYAPKSVPYSALIRSLEAQRVRSVLFEEGSSQIFFNMFPEPASQEKKEGTPSVQIDDKEPVSSQKLGKTGVSRAQPAWQYCTRKIRHDESYLLGLLRSGAGGKVEYSSAPRSPGSVAATVIGTILTLWIPMSPLLWLMHRQISGRGDALKKRKKTLHAVKFEDVAGVDTAKAELWEIVSCLKGHSNFQSLGAKFPKGVLLIGPPGTGKTLLARALAGEAGVPFFAASASEFVEMFVGRGAARIRELFATARKYAPSVIFIDELDAVGGQRGRGFNDERDQTLNQLLTEMDGFESETGVLVLAATNRAEALDPALCRAGRFSRKVYVKEPDLEGRKQVLAVHMRGVKVENDPELIQQFIASITPGFVGADLANLVNEAALLAARRGQSAVTLEDFKEAVYRSKYGVGQEPSILSSIEKKMCAFLQNAGVTNKVDGYPATM